MEQTKFCKWCGEKIAVDAEICPKCGRRVEAAPTTTPQVVVNNSNQNVNAATSIASAAPLRAKNKWVAFFLCLFFGMMGAHKFYEGKTGMGILYLFTGGLFCVGVLIDLFAILSKPRIYYVI